MYEPIRAKSVHTMAEPVPDLPHRTRDEELGIRLAGHLTALLTITDELRSLTPGPDLDDAAQRICDQVARLREGASPLRAVPTTDGVAPRHATTRAAVLHQRAHTLAGIALVVATSRDDAECTALAAERMQAHAAALGIAE